jgi:hypothetical protein
MGGLFRAPKPEVVEVSTPEPVATTAAPEPASVASDARVANRQRALRGRPGTIATSERGVLAPLPNLARKTLLGE